jgi:4-amino-4-deoxy-L-arabinose transferase-like glycosyltransferase
MIPSRRDAVRESLPVGKEARLTAPQRVLLLALLGAAAFVYTLPIGARLICSQDEARAALLAQDALRHGLRLPARVRDEPYLNKPPLFFWSVGLAAWPTGRVSHRVASIPSIASALAALLGVFAIGRRLSGTHAGLVALAVLATSPGFFVLSHSVLPDMMFAAWLTWALYFFLRALAAELPERAHLIGFYLCLAGALWTKGPPALIAVPAAVAAAVASRGFRRQPSLRPVVGLGFVALMALPWAIPYAMTPGHQRGQAISVGYGLAWYFDRYRHLSSIPLGDGLFAFLPWTVWLVLAAIWWRSTSASDRQAYRPMLAWMAVFLGLLALSVQQRERYLLPVYPLFALVVAGAVTSAESHARSIVRACAAILGVTLVVAVVAGGWFAFGSPLLDVPIASLASGPLWQRALVVVLGVGGPTMALWDLRTHRSPGRAAWWIAGALACVLLIEARTYPARLAAQYPIRTFADRARAALDPGALLLAHPDANLAFDFYLDRPIAEVPARDAIVARLRGPAADAVLLRERDWLELSGIAHFTWCPVGRVTLSTRSFVLLASCR